MVTSKELKGMGWPKGKAFGLALEIGREMHAGGSTQEEILAHLDEVRENPAAFREVEGPVGELAVKMISEAAKRDVPQLRETPIDAPVWGRELIDARAIEQLENAMDLPVTVAGALMPDAHVGYGIPIGGVVALEDAVAPYMVGVDIACRMMMSIYPVDFLEDFRTKINVRDGVRKAMVDETRFGMGAKFEKFDRREHEVMDDPAWEETKLLRHLKDRGHAQLGTSGTGNHFVDAGVITISEEGTNDLGLAPGEYFALMSHSGSRGVGANICNHYSKLAMKMTTLPKKHRHLAWLPMETEEGEEYWLSMNLAGRYASANHHTMHSAMAKSIGEKPLVQVENHHNFAWLEEHGGRNVYVHRKGATPAGEGELGIVPGSMGHDSFIVRGKGNEASLKSASHGAGRLMSRRQAIDTLPKKERNEWLAELDIELIGGGMDEAPMAYKNIEEVLAEQTDLLTPIARFRPKIVLMASDGKSEG